MTGTVMKVQCKVGDVVEADQALAVLTAMKMEHKLSSGVAGVVRKVVAVEGATVEQGSVCWSKWKPNQRRPKAHECCTR